MIIYLYTLASIKSPHY